MRGARRIWIQCYTKSSTQAYSQEDEATQRNAPSKSQSDQTMLRQAKLDQVGMLLLDVIIKKLDCLPLGVFLNERQDRCWLISIRKEIC